MNELIDALCAVDVLAVT